MYRLIYVIIVVVIANELFFLFEWTHISGLFNILDVGNAMIMGGLCLSLMQSKNFKIYHNTISMSVVVLMFIIAIQVCLASLNFRQSLLEGFISVRHWFYYLSFFSFVFFIKTEREVVFVLNILCFLAFIVVILSIVNYFGPTIFHHQWAEGHHSRAGITRAFIPAMDLVSISLLWQFCKWIEVSVNKRLWFRLSTYACIFFLSAHFFRQTRSSIIAAVFVLCSLLFLRRRLKVLVVLVSVSIVAYTIAEMKMKDNIVVSPFKRSIEDVSEGEEGSSSWKGRLEQIAVDFEEFSEHPLIGSGLIAIKDVRKIIDPVKRKKLLLQVKMADLGYTHWIKAFGCVGILWLIFFLCSFWFAGHKALVEADKDDRPIALFALSYLGFVIISFVTLNHFMFPHRILLICLVAAIIVRLNWNQQEMKKEIVSTQQFNTKLESYAPPQ